MIEERSYYGVYTVSVNRLRETAFCTWFDERVRREQ